MKQPFRVHEEYMWIGQKNLMKLFAYQMLEPSHFQDLPQMNVHCVDPKLNFPHLLQQTIYGNSVHHLSYHSWQLFYQMIHSEELQVTVGTKQLIEPANRGRKLNMQQHDVNQK